MTLLSWLENQKEFPKVYWRDRKTCRVFVASGSLKTISTIPSSPDRLYFGGLSFSNMKKESLWDDFPSCYFFAPKMFRHGIDRISSKPILLPKFIRRIDTPNRKQWNQHIERALVQIEQKEIEKVVLARRTTLHYKAPLNPFNLMRLLQSRAKNATLFLIQLSPSSTFLGASPEKLYERTGSAIAAEAIAGTCLIGKQKQLNRPKERREFTYVKQFIHASLSPLCTTHAWEAEDTILTTTGIQHLYNRLTGSLKTVSDAQIIQLLHPTPAMAGYPQIAALSHLNDQEPFDRGWYAAPLGWIGIDQADIAVGIRSALIREKEMHLFAATGIVKGSKPQEEWNELNLKLRVFI